MFHKQEKHFLTADTFNYWRKVIVKFIKMTIKLYHITSSKSESPIS